MEGLSVHEITVMLLSLGLLLGAARLLGEIAQWLHQPAIIGELLAGVLLGPTVFGYFAPAFQGFLFPSTGANAIAMDAIANLAIVLFLLVAGMEVDISTIWRQGRLALKVGVLGTLVPLAIGLTAAGLMPGWLGRSVDTDPLIFALFIGIALSISALPVIAKTLMDLDLYRTDLGMVVISAAIFNDLLGWIAFALVLGLIGASTGHDSNVALTISLTLLFAAGMLTVGRWTIHRLLPYLQAYTHWPGGVLGFAITLALLGAAFTEWIGIHAIFGSFLVGVALGDSGHLREHTRVMIDQFVSFIFAPVFFAGIGLKVNFLTHFDFGLVLLVLVLACAGKLIGATWGARWGGMSPQEAWSVGFAMNARGAMEIILGLLALQAGVIEQPLFVALVVMAIVTSMMSGPAIRFFLKRPKSIRLAAALLPRAFIRHLQARTWREAIPELAAAACEGTALDRAAIERAAWAREVALPTGIGNGVAIPHARVSGMKEPLVAVGFSEAGIDFDAPDGLPAQVIFLVLTPREDPAAQLELAGEVARRFSTPESLQRVLRINNFTEFLAAMKTPLAE